MNKRLIRVDGDDFTGWCSSHCPWDILTPRLESTVAARALNHLAPNPSLAEIFRCQADSAIARRPVEASKPRFQSIASLPRCIVEASASFWPLSQTILVSRK